MLTISSPPSVMPMFYNLQRRVALFGSLSLMLLNSMAMASSARPVERLGRGVVAIRQSESRVFVSWRLLGSDPQGIAFHLYRKIGNQDPLKLTAEPLTETTWFVDKTGDVHTASSYFVRPFLMGREGEPSRLFDLPAHAPAQPFLSVPLKTLRGYTPNDASVGDLDGDGEYEIILHQAGRGRDNSQSGETDPPLLEAYKLDGTMLWRIHLGVNLREGAHYTQFMVYDLDGDGRAEVACKTADGTVDGVGKVIGDATADYRSQRDRTRGKVLAGPEFLTLFDGRTGAERVTVDYVPARHPETDSPTPDQMNEIWGDNYGNRMDRFLACIAYLDGERPSLVLCRGYYTRTVLAAWNWRDGTLAPVWTFDSHDGTPGNRDYAGQGNHGLSVGDVDGDGRDEILFGACVIDDDGTGLYSMKLGHGDAMHFSDLDPGRPGLEVFGIHEKARHPHGIEFHDARTGDILWSKPSPDVGRGLSLDIDPRFPGHECWAAGPGLNDLYSSRGEAIGPKPRSCNMGVWWDGDLLRELLDGTRIEKWNYEEAATTRLLDAGQFDCVSNNGTKANPCLSVDLLGDWREEVIWRTRDNQELRIFTTTHPTPHRLPTLMHDPVYRLGIAWQNVAYNQPPHTGYFLGHGSTLYPHPERRAVGE